MLNVKKRNIEAAMRATFQNSNQLKDARIVLGWMKVAGKKFFSFQIGVDVLVFSVVAILLFVLGLGYFSGLVLIFILWGLFRIKRSGQRERECARAELERLMEFEHVQFPYWKGIAERLKKILEKENAYRKGMLPSHVLDEKD